MRGREIDIPKENAQDTKRWVLRDILQLIKIAIKLFCDEWKTDEMISLERHTVSMKRLADGSENQVSRAPVPNGLSTSQESILIDDPVLIAARGEQLFKKIARKHQLGSPSLATFSPAPAESIKKRFV